MDTMKTLTLAAATFGGMTEQEASSVLSKIFFNNSLRSEFKRMITTCFALLKNHEVWWDKKSVSLSLISAYSSAILFLEYFGDFRLKNWLAFSRSLGRCATDPSIRFNSSPLRRPLIYLFIQIANIEQDADVTAASAVTTNLEQVRLCDSYYLNVELWCCCFVIMHHLDRGVDVATKRYGSPDNKPDFSSCWAIHRQKIRFKFIFIESHS